MYKSKNENRKIKIARPLRSPQVKQSAPESYLHFAIVYYTACVWCAHKVPQTRRGKKKKVYVTSANPQEYCRCTALHLQISVKAAQ